MKKHILCFGDSNTHGYCPEPSESVDRGERYNEEERWTCLLQKALGEDYLVLENGVNGRTTAFSDPFRPYISGLGVIEAVLMAHRPLDLLIVMLGTNDVKERYGMSAQCIGFGLEKLCFTASITDAWSGRGPNILVIAPPHLDDAIDHDATMGAGCAMKSRQLSAVYREICEKHGWHFLDAEGLVSFSKADFCHMSARDHRVFARKLSELVPGLI